MSQISIHRLCREGSKALGPGLRYVVWTQGCPLRCKGCLTPGGHSTERRMTVKATELAEDIASRKNIAGVTISGGEPFIQADALSDMVEKLHTIRPELTVIIFTGFLKENLIEPQQQRLLSMTDLLIDGPYVEEKNNGKGLRGSSNQRLHFLTDRLLEHREELEYGKRRLEVIVSNKEIIQIGIPNK